MSVMQALGLNSTPVPMTPTLAHVFAMDKTVLQSACSALERLSTSVPQLSLPSSATTFRPTPVSPHPHRTLRFTSQVFLQVWAPQFPSSSQPASPLPPSHLLPHTLILQPPLALPHHLQSHPLPLLCLLLCLPLLPFHHPPLSSSLFPLPPLWWPMLAT